MQQNKIKIQQDNILRRQVKLACFRSNLGKYDSEDIIELYYQYHEPHLAKALDAGVPLEAFIKRSVKQCFYTLRRKIEADERLANRLSGDPTLPACSCESPFENNIKSKTSCEDADNIHYDDVQSYARLIRSTSPDIYFDDADIDNQLDTFELLMRSTCNDRKYLERYRRQDDDAGMKRVLLNAMLEAGIPQKEIVKLDFDDLVQRIKSYDALRKRRSNKV